MCGFEVGISRKSESFDIDSMVGFIGGTLVEVPMTEGKDVGPKDLGGRRESFIEDRTRSFLLDTHIVSGSKIGTCISAVGKDVGVDWIAGLTGGTLVEVPMTEGKDVGSKDLGGRRESFVEARIRSFLSDTRIVSGSKIGTCISEEGRGSNVDWIAGSTGSKLSGISTMEGKDGGFKGTRGRSESFIDDETRSFL